MEEDAREVELDVAGAETPTSSPSSLSTILSNPPPLLPAEFVKMEEVVLEILFHKELPTSNPIDPVVLPAVPARNDNVPEAAFDKDDEVDNG
jgi:hypothetical protein